jgi:hypothetical protein
MWLYGNSFRVCVCVCVCVCVRACACVWGGGAYLVEIMSWNVLEVAWKVSHGPTEDGFKRDRNM